MTTDTLRQLPQKTFGKVVTTTGVAENVPAPLISRLLERHFSNDWGDLDAEDAELNAAAINAGSGRVMSNYSWPGLFPQRIYIISYLESDPDYQDDPNACYTCVLFPSEY